MPLLILLRHGQSMWNAADLFTGWVDVPLSSQGIDEALAAGAELRRIPIDVVHTSTLIRAQQTAMLALADHSSGLTPILIHPKGEVEGLDRGINSTETGRMVLPVHTDWRLNERNYGDLQGLNKQTTRDKYGDAQVHIWRRSFDVPPPGGESLELCAKRTIPCLQEKIIPDLESGMNVLVAAHGNSLRSIVMHIEGLSRQAVLELEIGTGIPLFYDFEVGVFSPAQR
jgi:2,3-bisphosphoglycerate-dependent phosphoglycerate mutase